MLYLYLGFVEAAGVLRPVDALRAGPVGNHTAGGVANIVAIFLRRAQRLVHDLHVDPLPGGLGKYDVAIVVVLEVLFAQIPSQQMKE